MDQRLKEAAKAGDLNALYASIKQNPYILQQIDDIPFVDTPLHLAASAGKTHFAIEIISLKPAFGKKLNADGLSPLDLALQIGHFETARQLVKFDIELIRVKGRERITPLHYVAETDNIDLLAEFLYACPASIEDLNIRNETALHIAVKNFRLRAFKVLLGWLLKTLRREVLNWRDEDGNTALHIAVATDQTQVVKILTEQKVRTNLKNLEGLTPLNMAVRLQNYVNNEEVRKILLHAKASRSSSLSKTYSLADFLGSKERFYETALKYLLYWQKDFTMDKRNIVLIVAVLITTATYQGVLSPPGGVWQAQVDTNPPNYSITLPNGSFPNPTVNTISAVALMQNQSSNSTAGKVIMKGESLLAFTLSNTIVFTLSILVLMMALPWEPYSFLLHIGLASLWSSYSTSFGIISPSTIYNSILIFACMFILLFVYYARLTFWAISDIRNIYG
ncbi:hypothetical protein NMG60_11027428, partial [Bertholletia excelsa]